MHRLISANIWTNNYRYNNGASETSLGKALQAWRETQNPADWRVDPTLSYNQQLNWIDRNPIIGTKILPGNCR